MWRSDKNKQVLKFALGKCFTLQNVSALEAWEQCQWNAQAYRKSFFFPRYIQFSHVIRRIEKQFDKNNQNR